MAQRNQLSWGELRVGLFVLAGVTLLIMATFYVTGFGILASKYGLITYLPEVSQLTKGAPVRLDGIDVGSVDDISVNPALGNEKEASKKSIVVSLRINSKYKENIRTDSRASLITEGLLGNRYVNITRGFSGVPLKNGDVVEGESEKGINTLVAQGANLAQHLNALSDNLNGLIDDVRAGHGSLGRFITDPTAYNNFNGVSSKLNNMLANVEAGQGMIGKLYTSDDLYNKFNSATGRFDNILGAVQQQKGTAGKLIYDSSLHDNMNQFIGKGNAMFDDIHAGKGTLGKLVTDDSLFSKWREAGENVSTATAKFNSNQNTVGKLFTDPQLYDNITGLTGDMRLLLNDFRQNPKKFLRVKFSIF
ncbi:MAG TPA: MlaD family protein [Candidatus Acidoferrales bacterium]|nr:MlaD family protein [Candidatus Acidoferrales bacterium]